MKKIGVFAAALFAVSLTVNAAQIFEAKATSVTGTDFANHYGNNYAKGGWNNTPVTLDLSSPHIAKNAVRNGTTYGAPSVFVALSREAGASDGNFRGGGFGCSPIYLFLFI